MVWRGTFQLSMAQALRGVDGYFREEAFGIRGPDETLRVVQATPDRVTIRANDSLGEISFVGTGLQLVSQSVPGGVGSFPKLAGGTITRIEMRFNPELDGLISALALATTQAQRNAILAEIPNVSNPNFLVNAGVFQTEPFSAAALGNAVQAAYNAGSPLPLTNFLGQFNFVNTLLGEGVLLGGNSADLLIASNFNSQLDGAAGNDTLDAGNGGLNQMLGGPGSDLYVMGAGTEVISDNGTGTGEIDLISFVRSPTGLVIDLETIDGNVSTGIAAGDQWSGIEGAIGSRFNDTFVGRSFVFGDPSADQMFGGDGDDSFQAGEGADTIQGGRGFDVILGGPNQSVTGTPGRGDLAIWEAGPNEVHFFNSANGLLVATPEEGVDLVQGIELFQFAGQVFTGAQLTLSNALLQIGEGGNDVLEGGNAVDLLFGRAGADNLSAGASNDLIDAGAGNDTASGGAGADTLSGRDGADRLFGNQGQDLIRGHGGNDRLDGGQGNDSVEGGNGADTVFGGSGFDTLRGGNGNDTMVGGDGRDEVHMGNGADLFVDNTQAGVNGRDTVFGGTGNDTMGGGAGDDVFHGQDGNDLMKGRLGADRLFGGNQNDTLEGGDGNDTVAGGNGQDRAFMGNGNDTWFDNAQVRFGNDFVVGGNGNDTIRMGGGNDTATGGAGADVFVFADSIQEDRITDYAVGVDALQIDADLWDGARTFANFTARTEVLDGDLIFGFGGGDRFVLEGVGARTGVFADIELI